MFFSDRAINRSKKAFEQEEYLYLETMLFLATFESTQIKTAQLS